MEKSPPYASALWGGALGLGVVVAALLIGTGVRVAFAHASASVVSAAVTSIALVVIAWRWSRLATGAAIVTTFALVPLILLGASWVLSDPLVVMSFRCGTGDIGFPILAVAVVFLGGMLAFPFALFANKMHRALVLIAAVTVVASAITSVFGVLSLRRPEPDAFRALFTRGTTLAPGGTVVLGSRTFTWDTRVTPAAAMGERHCSLHASDGDERIEVMNGDVCPRLNLLLDPTSDLVLVSIDGNADGVAWFGRGSTYGRNLVISDFPDRLGAPRAWVFGGVGGFVIAVFAFTRAIAARRRAKNVRAIEAAHVGAGWVKVDDAPPRHLPELATHAPGPVVVLDARAVTNASYRDDGAPVELRVALASRESLRAAEYARAIAWSCVAIAAASASSMPLWTSRLFGLL